MSRVWDIPPQYLCKNHLLGEHRELHGVFKVIIDNKKGYSNHPETKRWIGKLGALWFRHLRLVNEMSKRNYKHNSNLPFDFESNEFGMSQNEYVNTLEEQLENIIGKKCNCKIKEIKQWIEDIRKEKIN